MCEIWCRRYINSKTDSIRFLHAARDDQTCQRPNWPINDPKSLNPAIWFANDFSSLSPPFLPGIIRSASSTLGDFTRSNGLSEGVTATPRQTESKKERERVLTYGWNSAVPHTKGISHLSDTRIGLRFLSQCCTTFTTISVLSSRPHNDYQNDGK